MLFCAGACWASPAAGPGGADRWRCWLCAPGDEHDLGLICFGLALRDHGWRMAFLGADTPLAVTHETARKLRPARVVLSTSRAENLDGCREQLAGIARVAPLAIAGAGARAELAEQVGAIHLAEGPLAAAGYVAAAGWLLRFAMWRSSGEACAGLVCAQDLTRAGARLPAARGRGRDRGTRAHRRHRRLSARPRLSDPAARLPPAAATDRPRRARHRVLRAGREGARRRALPPRGRPAAAAPLQIAETLRSPIGSAADKARTARLVLDVRAHSVRRLLRRSDSSTAQRLRRAGFSEHMIECFWRPLFAGIQLDPALEVSSRRFETILRMIAQGPTGLPRRGMGALPRPAACDAPAGMRAPARPCLQRCAGARDADRRGAGAGASRGGRHRWPHRQRPARSLRAQPGIACERLLLVLCRRAAVARRLSDARRRDRGTSGQRGGHERGCAVLRAAGQGAGGSGGAGAAGAGRRAHRPRDVASSQSCSAR